MAHRASTHIHSKRSIRSFKVLPPCVQSASLYTDNLWSKRTKFWALLILEVSSSLLINSFLPYLPQFWSDWSAKPAVCCALPSFAFTNRNFKAWYWPFTGTISSKFNLILSQTVLEECFCLEWWGPKTVAMPTQMHKINRVRNSSMMMWQVFKPCPVTSTATIYKSPLPTKAFVLAGV